MRYTSAISVFMKKPVLTLLIISIVNCCTWAQRITPQVINVSGGSWAQGYYSIDWSIGELALADMMQSADGSVIASHGFIQPFTDHPNAVIFNNTFNDDEIKILPNPTRDVLEVNYLSLMRGPVQFRMYDATGKLLYASQLTSYGFGFIERINMTRYAAGPYMLYISAVNNDIGGTNKKRTYKIIKTN
jgi:hypothetical protein